MKIILIIIIKINIIKKNNKNKPIRKYINNLIIYYLYK